MPGRSELREGERGNDYVSTIIKKIIKNSFLAV